MFIKPTCLTPDQLTAIRAAMAELAIRFPNLSAQELVAGPLAEFAYGRLPSFSNLATHKVTKVASATVGAFVLCHAVDPLSHERVALLIRRSDKGPDGAPAFGVPGGFTNLDFTEANTFIKASTSGEQPAQGAVRELCEEILDAAGRPILDLDPARLYLITSGVDYRPVAKGDLPVHYNGHAVALTPEELAHVRAHAEKLGTNPDYKRSVQIRSKGEVSDVILMKLADTLRLQPEQFTHPHELEALRKLHALPEPQRHITLPLISSIAPPPTP